MENEFTYTKGIIMPIRKESIINDSTDLDAEGRIVFSQPIKEHTYINVALESDAGKWAKRLGLPSSFYEKNFRNIRSSFRKDISKNNSIDYLDAFSSDQKFDGFEGFEYFKRGEGGFEIHLSQFEDATSSLLTSSLASNMRNMYGKIPNNTTGERFRHLADIVSNNFEISYKEVSKNPLADIKIVSEDNLSDCVDKLYSLFEYAKEYE